MPGTRKNFSRESVGSDKDSNQPTIVERNVRAIVQHSLEQERHKSTADRFASAISAFAGSMNFVYFHAVAFGLWAAADMGWLPAIPNFDPTFTKLGTLASIEAIFLATFVLIAQNRMAAQEQIRNHLDVQVSLLNEHETTHILRLVTAIGDKMGLEESKDPSIQELLRDLKPQEMIDKIAVQADAVVEEIRTDSATT